MRTLRLAAAAALVSLTVAGCAEDGSDPPAGDSPGGPSEATAEFERRAGEVAVAWRGSEYVDAWQTGLVLLEPPTVLPESASDDVTSALRAGWVRTSQQLAADVPEDGEVRFDNGETLPVPLVSAADAWQEIHSGDPECPDEAPSPPAGGEGDPDDAVSSAANCHVVTITDVQLGTATVTTSRGPAEVPAWLFKAESGAELARVAVDPDVVAETPVLEGVDFRYFDGLANAMQLVEVDGAQVTYHLGIGACDIDVAPLVYETDDLVILGGTARMDPTVDACTDQLVNEEVSVTLDEEVGTRPILSTTGEVLTFGRW